MPEVARSLLTLAIESSCDESALALFAPSQGLVGEWVHSQIALHRAYGGVVPDLASREHVQHLGRLLAEAQQGHSLEQVGRIAVTTGPGLAGCLAVGMAQAQALALAWGVPVLPVNHLRAHALSVFIRTHAAAPECFTESLTAALPHLGLLVSGGNTLLFMLHEDLRMEVVAETVDDAAGEALDKGAKLLGLPYPGGPLIEQHGLAGNPRAFAFPSGITQADDLRFSYSGLKTSLRYLLEKLSEAELKARFADLCASYQQAVIEQLLRKLKHALRQHACRSLGLSGGVANNQQLRERLGQLAQQRQLPLFLAEPRHTGDNAGMIAFAAHMDPSVRPATDLRMSPSARLA